MFAMERRLSGIALCDRASRKGEVTLLVLRFARTVLAFRSDFRPG